MRPLLLALLLILPVYAQDPLAPAWGPLFAQTTPPQTLTRFKARYPQLPLHLRLVWSGTVWGEAATCTESFSGNYWIRDCRHDEHPWSEKRRMDSRQCYEVDSNGLVSSPQGADEQILRTHWRLLSGQWLLDEGCSTPLPADSAGNPRLRYQAPGGLTATLTFNPDGDLSSAELGHVTLRWSHYAQTPGGYLAGQESLTYDGLAVPETYQLQSAETAPESQALPPPPPDRTKLTACELPLSLVQDRWTQVDVRMGGRNYIFLLDSGASDTIIDSGAATELGFPRWGAQTLSSGLFKEACYVRSGPMQVGGLDLPERTVVGLNLRSGPFARAFPGVVGILGRDIFARCVVVFDYVHSRLFFIPRERYHPLADDHEIECRREGPGLAMKVQLADQVGYFTLDTGSGAGVLVQHLGGQQRWVRKGARLDPNGASFGSGSAATKAGSADLSVGPYTWRGAPLEIVDEKTAQGSALVTQGNVGVGFLRHFRVALDITGGRMWLAQQRPFRQSRLAGLGLHCGDGLVVSSVVPGGPADRAGLRPGDTITAINGGPSTPAGADELFDQALPGEPFDLDIQRDGKPLRIHLTAELP